MLKKLQLSSEEKRSIKFEAEAGSGENDRPPQAVAKLFSERNVCPDVIEQSVGWIWCPTRGISCKDLGDNVFLISFNQASGLRRTLDDGPWMISKELLVVTEFAEVKSVDEFDFSIVPIWMRVERLPLGLMNRAAARAIGDDVGEFVEVDANGSDLAVGRDLRLKVRMDICKPLCRGILADLGPDKGDWWCPITYKHLPDFCYICRLIGHVDRPCSKKLGKGEKAPYSRELRYIPPCKPIGGFGRSGSWRAGHSDSWSSGSKSQSDGPSWRKDVEKGDVKVIEGRKDDGEEVTSPIKEMQLSKKTPGVVRTELFPKEVGDEHTVKNKEGEKDKFGGKFKRVKRDGKRQMGETIPGETRKNRRGRGEDMDLDEQAEVKRSESI
ncbi:unnamed protein product [Miscanthus lutarioriparius]|uniref:DUF4283 domain-containing protein n=1 Tax=Miscanthus lutarioriparius TaxID=422564 RepID=A0A811S5S3_9POAL|nr:unnamed protein product [Miscanthus lutarioriparius]